MASPMLTSWIKSQKLKGPAMKNEPVFYRNLEEAIDVRRKDHALLNLRTNISKEGGDGVDFISNDVLALGTSGQLRAEFMRELERYPNLALGSGSTRMVDGNYEYIEMVEKEIANFHRAETGVIVGSGFNANVAILSAIPRPGDAIVYDDLVHASTHDGMTQSQAVQRVSFRHNDPDALQEVLLSVCDAHPLIKQGKRCILIAVESTYSFDGDTCPLKELIEVAKDVCPLGNAQFIVDEAHSTGVIGPNGSGLVCELGLEKEIAIRLHTFGKALASTGAIILGNETIKTALINFGRNILYSTSPGPLSVAAIRSAYKLMREGETKAAQENLQHLVKHFFKRIDSNPIWEKARDRGILDVPLAYDWEDKPCVTPIVPIWTRQRYAYWLVFHLGFSKFDALPVDYPNVSKGKSRVRLMFHANNTESEVERLVAVVADWAQEMIDLESENAGEHKIPKAARQVYSWMGSGNAEEIEAY